LFQDEIGLKEWAQSLRMAHKTSHELLTSMAKKAGKIYGTDPSTPPSSSSNHHKPSPCLNRSTNGN
jgi:beta-adrenergic-receptor kinase